MQNLKMAVCSIKLVLLFSIVMLQSTVCVLQSTTCELPSNTCVLPLRDTCLLPSTTCEVQWTLSAVSLGTPNLYTLIAKNSATVHEFLTQINDTQVQTVATNAQMAKALQNQTETLTQMAATQSQAVVTRAEIANALQNQTETLTQIATTQTQAVAIRTQMASALQNQTETLSQIATTQTQVVVTRAEMANALHNQTETLTQMAATLSQAVVTRDEIANALQNQTETLTQMAATQAQMANAFGQVVALLQNITATLNTVLPALESSEQETMKRDPSPRDCSDLASRGDYPSGAYTLTLWKFKVSPDIDYNVFCDMDTADGGWTVIQKRFDGSIDFFRGWNDYQEGFGDLDGEFWAGLELIHLLTRHGKWIIRFELEDFDNSTAYAQYDSFQLGDASSNYILRLGTYQGTAGDAMTHSNNMQFTTYDRDNDVWSTGNCAEDYPGAWWYRSCTDSNLNGLYLGSSITTSSGMLWYRWKNSYQSLKKSEIKIKRVP